MSAGATAEQRLSRLLALLPALADDAWHAIADLATVLGTTPQQVRDDLQGLNERAEDVPAGFVEGIRVFIERQRVKVHAPLFARPMVMAPDEMAAISLGLAMLRQEGDPDEATLIERARSRTANLAPRRTVRTVRTAAAADATPPGHRWLGPLQRAWAASRMVDMQYTTSGASAARQRRLAPYRLVYARGGWYVIGDDVAARAVKVYRLDRITGLRLTSVPYAVPPSFDLDAYVRDGKVFHREGAGTLVVRYTARIARWILEHETPSATHADGSVEITYPLADDGWAVRHVLRYGPDAQVLAPHRIRERVLSVLRRMT